MKQSLTKKIMFAGGVLLILLLSVLAVVIADIKTTNQQRNNSIEETSFRDEIEYLDELTQDQLEQKVNSRNQVWVYVGRPNCQDCQIYYPKLIKYLKEIDGKIFYFNTRVKTSEKKAMIKYLAENNVDEIPAVLHFENANVVKVYDMQKDSDIELFEKEYEYYVKGEKNE